MSDQRDEFYQPWLREPASPPAPPASPVKRRYDGEANAGLSRDEAIPLGVDLSGYAVDESPAPPPLPDRVKPIARSASDGLARLASSCRKGALAFADWTIDLGQRADVPARVAALEIPRRSGVALHRSGRMLAAAGRAIAAASGRAGSATAKRLGAAGEQARAAAGRAASSVKSAADRQIAARRPVDVTATPPDSGLDRLLADEQALASRRTNDTSNLPLFSPPIATVTATTEATSGPAQAVPPATPAAAKPAAVPSNHDAMASDERPARPVMPQPPRLAGSSGGGGLSALPSAIRRWLPWALAALLVLALTFWLGSRWGGSGMNRAEVETIVRETILANPQIVPEAFERHQSNQIAATIDDIRPLLEKPFSGAWIGNAKGDVTLTIFTDYGCVFCRASVPDVDRLVREDKGVKVVFRELPIIAPQSKDAAIAALAAARQGKYDAFHHAMFAAPGLDRAAIDAASTRAGVILDGRSDANADVRLFEREIDSNLALAQQLGINGTPSWVVGSKLMQGAVGYGELKKAVAAARAAN